MKNFLVYSFLFFAIVGCKKEGSSTVTLIESGELVKLMTQKNIQLVDVRTQAEYDKGAIKDAVLIDFWGEGFVKKVAAKFNKKEAIYIYCQKGGRSSKASKMLLENGFQNVYDLKGGYGDWKATRK
ncbi:MAG: rhodanese-like domain-containing protein [Flavobacteriaceae bacterium]|nr:rhodanese-like domain-containing protein [Flavobacteriaceae bacterium]